MSVWIGEIQWMRRNGFSEARDPILKPLDTIECRDAILTPDNTEPDWSEADVVIGNPPFLGGKLLITNLGEDYVSRMFETYAGRVPAEADLVCYWFEKAGQQIASGKANRAGLVATNSIRGGANRRALGAATNNRRIFDAWSNEPWVIDGAAVRVSLVCFSGAGDESVAGSRLDGAAVDEIYTDLTARRDGVGVDLTKARRLAQNAGVAFMGDTKGGPFNISGDRARNWLRPAREPERPHERRRSEAMGERNGPHPTASGKVDRRLRVNHVSRRRRAVRRTVPLGPRTRLPDAPEEPPQSLPAVLVETRRAAAGHAAGARRTGAIHRDASRSQAPAVRLARCPRLSRLGDDRYRPRRRHDIRDSAQPVPRDLVATARDESGGPAAIHTNNHLRDVPVPARTGTERASDPTRLQPPCYGYSPSSPTPRRAA